MMMVMVKVHIAKPVRRSAGRSCGSGYAYEVV